ncbi:MAG: class I SAM-dependent methyltransferase, partial [Gammaproteobacteria bacterium]|nr:class I SAM-dependent methyltransferase [Gammaproteobacteria bacterium]
FFFFFLGFCGYRVLSFPLRRQRQMVIRDSLYSFKLLPFMGKAIANDAESYRYLAESIRMHPDQDTLKEMMMNAGFERTEYNNLTGGIVALHRGYKL